MASNDDEIGIAGTGGDENEQSVIEPDEPINDPVDDTGAETGAGDNTGGDGETGGNSVPDLTIDKNKDKLFQARVFHEKNKQVYGAEIILFDDDTKVIDSILITDKMDFDSWTSLIENMQNAYVPFSEQDKNNLDTLSKLKSGEIDETSEEYKNMAWSSLHDIGYLDEILKYGLTESDVENIHVPINASHLNGYQSGDFAKSLHDHDSRYLKVDGHEKIIATTETVGHSLIVDNLNETSLAGGKVLSANQGRVLKNEISKVDTKLNSIWSNVIKPNDYISYRYSSLLRLVVCNYKRSEYTGLKSETGLHKLHKENRIPEYCQPTARVITPLYRGDVTLYFNTDGSISIYNLTKHKSININAQVMWHY